MMNMKVYDSNNDNTNNKYNSEYDRIYPYQ